MLTVSVDEGPGGGGKDIKIHESNSKKKSKGRCFFTLCILELWNCLHQDTVGAKNFKKIKQKFWN